MSSYSDNKTMTDEELKKARAAEQLRLNQAPAGIHGPLRERTFDSYDPGPEGAGRWQALQAARRYVENEGRDPIWLLLAGHTGTGKSHLALAIATAVLAKLTTRVHYTKLARLMRRIRSTFRRESAESELEAVDFYQRARWLIIDEFVMGNDLTPWERITLDDILDHRWEQRKPTVIVSNKPAVTLFETVGDRFESRFLDCGEVVNFLWKDYRIKRRKERGKKGEADGKGQG